MNHRHLLPNEIDLLVDGEAGFGVAPLRAHVDECAECAERFEDALFVTQALEELPHFAPDARLADRVMARVPVFVPAHVALRNSVARWTPQSALARIVSLVLVGSTAGAFSLGILWLATQGDVVMFATELLGSRLRSAVLMAARDFTVIVLGEPALAQLQATGPIGASLLAGAFVLTAIGTVAGLRRLSVAGRR